MLTMSNVSYCYQKRKEKPENMVLQDVSAAFETGRFYAVYGPSGSGKTTLLSLLGGLDKPTSGEISLDQRDISEIGYHVLRKSHVSYVFQDFHLFTYMSAVENVMLAMHVTGTCREAKVAREKAIQLLASLGMDRKDLFRTVTKLSGGQQQRVALARALSTNASYILADEPTGNLDGMNTENIISILRSLVDDMGKCVIVVTHSSQVKDAADVCYEINDGRLST